MQQKLNRTQKNSQSLAVLFLRLQNRADGVFFGCLYYATMYNEKIYLENAAAKRKIFVIQP